MEAYQFSGVLHSGGVTVTVRTNGACMLRRYAANWNCWSSDMSSQTTTGNRQAFETVTQDRWIPFLAEFTRENRGAHARLEIIGPDAEAGYQIETQERPLQGVAADLKDAEKTVWITFGTTAEDHLEHSIHGAMAIQVSPPGDGRGAILEIQAEDGARAVLNLSSPGAFTLPPSDSRA
jgi:hypothetical protein